MYVLTDGATTVVEYPYTLQKLKQDNPNVSFPSAFPADWDGSDFNVFPVVETPEPAPSSPDVIVEEANPQFVDPDWVQVWVERAPNTSELDAVKDLKRRNIRGVFADKINDAALAAGINQDNLDLIDQTSNFAASVMSYLIANNSQGFRDNVNLCRQNAQSLMQAVNAATTLSEVDAVDPTTGWPV